MGAVDEEFTVIVREAQAVVLHVPSALTQYVVVEPGETPIELPVPISPLPQPLEYQFHEALVPNDPPTTDNIVAPPQVGFTLADILAGAVDDEFTVIVSEAQAVVLQVPDALTQ